MIFVNLPVSDLATARAFYEGLGFAVNDMFSDEHVVSVVVSDTIVVMLLDQERFASFTPLPVADARTSTQVLHCLSAASRTEVDAFVQHALAAGGTEFRATQDEGPMYGRSVADPDGHVWEILHMDLVEA
ncbi:VOC family protein [Cellulomonas shaoxiangyii]|uniref:Glyoxalase n=1 Tax=Cellulomonas shaoxiangyii TaxID=2566013 RepID=A0A4P7SPK5_9CELL|nr:VOC family protein [Cellulomonas shaoxiangyii]QCB95236.1 glyoxalase [Cellulomonas shaoxiangyii]TGY81423.1 glyoxalase [Cellulomonas shaoxiangyii]